MALKLKDLDDTQAPLLDHLVELRGRLVRAVLAMLSAPFGSRPPKYGNAGNCHGGCPSTIP